jgi:hypothetical protein
MLLHLIGPKWHTLDELQSSLVATVHVYLAHPLFTRRERGILEEQLQILCQLHQQKFSKNDTLQSAIIVHGQ